MLDSRPLDNDIFLVGLDEVAMILFAVPHDIASVLVDGDFFIQRLLDQHYRKDKRKVEYDTVNSALSKEDVSGRMSCNTGESLKEE